MQLFKFDKQSDDYWIIITKLDCVYLLILYVFLTGSPSLSHVHVHASLFFFLFGTRVVLQKVAHYLNMLLIILFCSFVIVVNGDRSM